MPLPQRLARFNRRVTNPIARTVAGRVPPFAIVEHRGRRSGTTYRTPVMAFRDGDSYVVALTYGPETDWVRNVLHQGGATLVRGGTSATVADPRIVPASEALPLLPPLIRRAVQVIGVSHYLCLSP